MAKAKAKAKETSRKAEAEPFTVSAQSNLATSGLLGSKFIHKFLPDPQGTCRIVTVIDGVAHLYVEDTDGYFYNWILRETRVKRE